MRRYHSQTGRNCLQCCIAGLFDMELEMIPDVDTFERDAEGKGWFDSFYNWSKLTLNHVPVAVTDDTLDDLLHIEVCETDKGVSHAVISKGCDLVYDPDGTYQVGPERKTEYRILFVPLEYGCQRRIPELDEFIEE